MAAMNICVYNKFGFCKYGVTCRKKHEELKCENASCEIFDCLKRHPRECRYFRDFKRCKYNEYCRYEHKENSEMDENGNRKCKDETKILELETRLENAEKSLRIINEKLIEKEELFQDIEKKLSEFVNECSVKTSLPKNPSRSPRRDLGSCSHRTYNCPCNQSVSESEDTHSKEVDQPEIKIIPLTSEEEDSDSVSNSEIEDTNPNQSKTVETKLAEDLTFEPEPGIKKMNMYWNIVPMTSEDSESDSEDLIEEESPKPKLSFDYNKKENFSMLQNLVKFWSKSTDSDIIDKASNNSKDTTDQEKDTSSKT